MHRCITLYASIINKDINPTKPTVNLINTRHTNIHWVMAYGDYVREVEYALRKRA
jgi:hypothetical protein